MEDVCKKNTWTVTFLDKNGNQVGDGIEGVTRYEFSNRKMDIAADHHTAQVSLYDLNNQPILTIDMDSDRTCKMEIHSVHGFVVGHGVAAPSTYKKYQLDVVKHHLPQGYMAR